MLNIGQPLSVVASGDGLSAAKVGETASFRVEVSGSKSESKAVEATLINPHGGRNALEVSASGEASYVPKDAGRYKIEVLCGKEPVSGSPFLVEVTAAGASAANCTVEGEAVDFFAPFDEHIVAGAETSL